MMTVNVKDFGAVADAVTDDTVAFHGARNAAGCGGEVVIPSGHYIVSGLMLDVNDQRWSFEHGAKLVRAADSVDAVITVSAQSVEIAGATVDCMRIDPVSGYGWGVFVQPAAIECLLENVHVLNATHMGIIICAASATVRKCRVTTSRQVGIFAYLGYSAADLDGPRISECVVDQSLAAPSDPTGGIFLRGDAAHGLKWLDCSIRDNEVILPKSPIFNMVGIEAIHTDRAVIRGNHVSGGYIGVSLGVCRDAVVSSNVCYAQQQIGVEVAGGSTDCVVVGNAIDGGSILQDGVELSGSNRVVVSGNSVRRVKATTGNCVAMISCYNVTISGNSLYPSGGKAGVYSQSVPSVPTLLSVSGNCITGNGTAEYAMQIDTPVGLDVSGNIVSSCSTGVQLQCSTPTSLSANLIGSNVFVSVPTPIGFNLINGSSFASSNRLVSNVGYLRNGRAADVLNVSSDVVDAWGVGAPEGTVAAGIGSIYRRQDGVTQLYQKSLGVGATGWLPV